MLRVNLFRVRPDKEPRLRAWLEELNARSDEVKQTFRDESVRAEQAYIIATSDGPILVYAMEAASFERGQAAYATSSHAIDREHKAVMAECLGEPLGLSAVYDVALTAD